MRPPARCRMPLRRRSPARRGRPSSRWPPRARPLSRSEPRLPRAAGAAGRAGRRRPPRAGGSAQARACARSTSDQVPSSQDARYFACSAVNWSMVDAHRRELEAGDLLVDLGRDRIDLLLERRGVLHRVLGRERLVREAHVHHDRRVTLGGRDVDEPALGEQEDAAGRPPSGTPRRSCAPRASRLRASGAPGCRSRR